MRGTNGLYWFRGMSLLPAQLHRLLDQVVEETLLFSR